MAARYWLTLPGRSAPIEVTAVELADKRARGELPAGTLVAPVGEASWRPLDDVVAELPAAGASADDDRLGAPLSRSASGYALLDAPAFAATMLGDEGEAATSMHGSIEGSIEGSIGGSIGGSTEGAGSTAHGVANAAHAPTVVGATAPSGGASRSRALAFGLVGAGIAGLSAIAIWLFAHSGYSRGTVLSHVPDDCRRLTYVDFAGIDALAAVSSSTERRNGRLMDWAEDADEQGGFRHGKGDDARGKTAALRALAEAGVHPFGDVREVALCELRGDDGPETVRAIGGSFGGVRWLTALGDALSRRTHKAVEDKLSVGEIDGHPALTLADGQVVVLATSDVALMGKKKTVLPLIKPHSVARIYGVSEVDLVVRREGGDAPTERHTRRDGDGVRYVWSIGSGKADQNETRMRDELKRAAARLRKSAALDTWTDGYDAPEITRESDGVRASLHWPTKDVAAAFRKLADADYRELGAMRDGLDGSEASDLLRMALTPGVDAFEINVGPFAR
jgi:hypothetical protein